MNLTKLWESAMKLFGVDIIFFSLYLNMPCNPNSLLARGKHSWNQRAEFLKQCNFDRSKLIDWKNEIALQKLMHISHYKWRQLAIVKRVSAWWSKSFLISNSLIFAQYCTAWQNFFSTFLTLTQLFRFW